MIKNLKILCLNCQKAYTPGLEDFLKETLRLGIYDFLLLQEADEKVVSIVENTGPYKILGAMNHEAGVQSHLQILYRESFVLKDSTFVSFASMNQVFSKRGEPGLLVGTFDCNGESIIVASAHLHPGLWFRIRAKEMHMIKDRLASYNSAGLPTLFGGDFNLGFPWENLHARNIFKSGFRDVTKGIGMTLNSLYTETGSKSCHIASKVGNFLAKFNIAVTFKTDCIFVDKKSCEQFGGVSKILPVRVSDHSPIEFNFKI